ncbi:hypothetical protein VPH35_033383 [Triticum aestivum]
MVRCSTCWQESCCNHSSYASGRPLLIDYNNLSKICLPENPVWLDPMLGDPVRVLVPRLWSVGLANPHRPSRFMMIPSVPSVSRCEDLGPRRKSSVHDGVRYYYPCLY